MVTAVDHIENLRKQLLDRKRSKELELEEINEMIRVLGQAPRVLKGEPAREIHQERLPEKSSERYNLTFARDIADYVASYPYGDAIKINPMLDTLRQEKGLKGKPKSLYAYASQVLKRMSERGELGLKHEDGVGYFRARPKSETDRTDSTLVHTA